jgi:predicted nucleic acid-binding protein
VADPFLLDTSAFITLTDREPGVERVRELLKAAKRGELTLYACFVSLTEVQYVKTYDVGAEKARRILGDIRKFPILWIHSDDTLCAGAADLKASHTIAFADAFVAAAALRVNAVLVHKDPQFAALAGQLKQEMLPPKTSTSLSGRGKTS